MRHGFREGLGRPLNGNQARRRRRPLPVRPSTVTSCPVRKLVVALPVPTTQVQPKLARDDRRMTGHAAPVGDQSGRSAHGGHPVGTRHLGDQDLAVEEVGLLAGGREGAHPL